MSNTLHTVVITTVGTSCIENYIEKKAKSDDLFIEEWKNIKDLTTAPEIEWEASGNEYNRLFVEPVAQWLQRTGDDGFRNCAEFQTMDKIEEKFRSIDEQHYLITDTVAGSIAGKTLEKVIGDNGKFYDISGLTVRSYNEFKKKGFQNLIKKIGDIIKGSKEEQKDRKHKQIKFVFNISEGYKAIIPVLTILAQLYENISMAYLYEDSEELILIKKQPLNFDRDLVEALYPYLEHEEILTNPVFWEDSKGSTANNKANDEDRKALKKMKEYSLIDENNKITLFGKLSSDTKLKIE